MCIITSLSWWIVNGIAILLQSNLLGHLPASVPPGGVWTAPVVSFCGQRIASEPSMSYWVKEVCVARRTEDTELRAETRRWTFLLWAFPFHRSDDLTWVTSCARKSKYTLHWNVSEDQLALFHSAKYPRLWLCVYMIGLGHKKPKHHCNSIVVSLLMRREMILYLELTVSYKIFKRSPTVYSIYRAPDCDHFWRQCDKIL